MKRIKKWIIDNYDGEDTPYGDLAYDIKKDKVFPNTTNTDKAEKYLFSKGACQDCLATFRELAILYNRAVKRNNKRND